MATQTPLNINLLIKFSIWHILSLYVQNFKKHIIFPGVRSTENQEVTEDCRHCEEEGIDSVEYAAVTRNNVAGIFYLERSFQQRFHKVPQVPKTVTVTAKPIANQQLSLTMPNPKSPYRTARTATPQLY